MDGSEGEEDKPAMSETNKGSPKTDTPIKKTADSKVTSTVENSKAGAAGAANNVPKQRKKVSKEIQDKIIAVLGQELEYGRKEVPKEEVAGRCGFQRPGTHRFFYSLQDLMKQGIVMKGTTKGCICLTDKGKDNIPQGVTLPARVDNAAKQMFFADGVRKACNAANIPGNKVDIIFDILKDGKPHSTDEIIEATGVKNMKTKSVGQVLTDIMEKKMSIIEKTDGKKYQFTDKCFPDGRP